MRWRILLLLFLARIGFGFQFQTLGAVGDDLIAVYGLDYTEVGTLIGLFMVPGLILALPAGYAGLYLSDRLLAALGLAALALGGLLSATADDTWMIGTGRIVAGIGFLFSTLYMTKMTADWFVGREIATAMSIVVMSWPFGIAMGQIGHEWLAATFDWRAPFYVASAYCCVAALALLTLYRTPPSSDAAPTAQVVGLSRREVHLVLLAGFAWAVFNAGYVVYLSFAPLMLESFGTGAFAAAAIISVASWVMIGSGALCGQIADRTGRPDTVLYVCMFGAVVSQMLLAVDGAGLAASLLFGLVGMAPAGIIMALSGEAMRADRRAFGMGVFLTIYYPVQAAAPPLAGWIFDQTERPLDPLLLGALLFALVVPANVLYRLIQRQPQAVVERSA